MNFSKRNKSIVDILFVLALFGAFAITGLFVVLFGANVYKSTVVKMDENYASRTALSYITEKVRSHDFSGETGTDGIDINERDGQSVLMLKEVVEGKTYITYLYLDSESSELREFTAGEDYDFGYNAGTKILNLKQFKATKVSNALYKFDIVDEYDNRTEFYVAKYSGVDE